MQVIIRPWEISDTAALAAIANNRHIWNHVRDRLPHPYTHADAAAWISFARAQEPVCNFAIEADAAVAGAIGFIQNEDIHRKNFEIGYYTGEAYWGRGIASAAVAQLVSHISSHFDAVRLYAGIFENNPASMRVLEKNGFHLECIHRKAVFKNGRQMDEYIWVKLLQQQ